MPQNYLVDADVAGHEATLDAYVAGVLTRTCQASGHYPNPYQLRGYPDCLGDTVIRYFLTQPFEVERVMEFCEQARRIDKHGFSGIHYPFGQWVKAHVEEPFFERPGDKWSKKLVLRPDVDATSVPPDYLRFVCYLALCHLRYGPSYASVTAHKYFDMATALGSLEVARLRQHGSGHLPPALTHYEDEGVRCVANDAFATIRITVRQEAAASYAAALRFLNELLPADFPKSYAIEFSAPAKHWLPVKGLPHKSVHALFANAVRYAELHPLLAAYARLAMRPDEWYNNLDGENCAMPGTFAVFALGLVSEAYFGLVTSYMRAVDEEHQSIQTKFTPTFVTRFSITDQSFPVFMRCLLSTQSHPHYPVLAGYFASRASLERLLACRRNFVPYLPQDSADEPADWADDLEEAQSLADYLWPDILHAIFGPAKNQARLLGKASAELRPLYEALFSTNSQSQPPAAPAGQATT